MAAIIEFLKINGDADYLHTHEGGVVVFKAYPEMQEEQVTVDGAVMVHALHGELHAEMNWTKHKHSSMFIISMRKLCQHFSDQDSNESNFIDLFS